MPQIRGIRKDAVLRSGKSLPLILVAVAVLGFGTVIAILVSATSKKDQSDTALLQEFEKKLEKKERAFEQQLAESRQKERDALAESKREQSLSSIRRALRDLDDLRKTLTDVQSSISELKGLRVDGAGEENPEVVRLSASVLEDVESDMVDPIEVDSRVAALKAFLATLQDTTAAPGEEVSQKVEEAAGWTSRTRSEVSALNGQLNAVLVLAKASKAPTPSRPPNRIAEKPEPSTVGEAVKKQDVAMQLEHRRLIESEVAKVRDEMATKLAEAKAAMAKQEAETKLEENLKDFQGEMNALVADGAAAREKTLAEKGVARAEIEAASEMLKVEAEKILTEATVAAAGMRKELEHKRLVSEIKTLGVVGYLAPFTSGGFWNPITRKAGNNIDPEPFSLLALRSSGALDPTMDGLHRLLRYGSYKNDTVRPRWEYLGKKQFSGSTSKRAQVKKAQDYLIKYGEALVKEKHLLP